MVCNAALSSVRMGCSPFETLRRYAHSRQQSLAIAAMQCLAIPPDSTEGKQVNVLVKAVIKQRLSAWSGTPKTLTSNIGVGFVNKKVRWEPDREITQLYIPGLKRIGQSAFLGTWHLYLGQI